MCSINKKGFTLIELLAVIIVLAVVTLLAVQAVLPQVEKARRNVFVVEVNHAIDAAKQWYSEKKLINDENNKCIKIGDLIRDGYFEVSDSSNYAGYVVIEKDANGVVTGYSIEMSNGTFETTTAHLGKIKTSEVNGTNSVIQLIPSGGTSINKECPTP